MPDQPATPPPAYFLSLSLENVRSFGQKQTISFATAEGRPAKWTIILGDNGVGKTTVLKALAATTPLEVGPLEHRYHTMYFARTQLKYEWLSNNRINKDETTLDGKIVISNIDSVNFQETEFFELKVKFGIDGSFSSGSSTLFSEDATKNLICYGYGAGRTTGNATLSETPETADTCASLFNDRADLLNPEEWFLQADYRMKSDQDSLTTQNFHLLNAALLEVMAEGEVTELRVSPTQPGSGNPNQGMRFKTPYGWVRLKDMSLGYQTLVVWLTDFASKLFIRYPQSKNPLREPAIVLIDEIDLHLHPSWQRKLISSLSKIFTNTQFIATAHSPLVVQAATDARANVVLLKREGDQTIVYQGHDLPDVRRWRIEQIMNSELFDDTPPLSAKTEEDLTRRNALLLKKRLTKAEKAELTRLTADLTGQPIGTTRLERRAEDLLAQLASNLGEQDLLP